MNTTRPSRAGISLLEVLIAIGILAIGLTSVLSFIPAGHSMAKTSLTTDQVGIVASNALADLATQGFLRPDSLSSVTAPLIIDPLVDPTVHPTVSGSWTALGYTRSLLRENGVLSVPSAASPPRAIPALTYLVRSRDDITYNVPDTDDIDVTNKFTDGIRAYSGNFSWMATLTKPTAPPFAAGDEATLTLVVFYNRDLDQPPTLVYSGATWTGDVTWPAGPGPLVPDRKNSELIRTNGICLVRETPGTARFRRISLAAINDNDSGAFIDFDGPQPSPGAGVTVDVYAIPDAVAMIEKTVTLEGASPYSE
jgi:hypothetical protein